jgi:hypothetical protein
MGRELERLAARRELIRAAQQTRGGRLTHADDGLQLRGADAQPRDGLDQRLRQHAAGIGP